MLKYNLLEYSQICLMTFGSLWNYYRGEIYDVNDSASDGKSSKYKTKIVGKTPERPERQPQPPQNPDGTQSPQPPESVVPALNAEVTIWFIILVIFGDFLIYH